MTENSGPIIYLTAQYPRATDTFIQREVAALRALGLDIRTCSIRKTESSHHVGDEQIKAVATTFQIQRAAKRPWHLIGAHLGLLFRRPRFWLEALSIALRTSPPGAKALLWQIFFFLEAGVLAAHLRQLNARHLHSHFGDTSTSVAMLAACLAGVPYSYTLHGPGIFYRAEHWRLDVKTARANFVACISHFARSQAMLFSDPAHWDKLRIVHCGVDPSRYNHGERKALGRHVVFVGRLAPEKGLLVLLDAFAEVRRSRPDAQLTLIGDGPEREQIAAKVAAMGLDDRVRFTGYLSQDDVAARLSQVDMLVLPSFAEGVPVVLMEAMASRLPVIATRIAGVAELVEDGVSGLLVPPGDPEALTHALATLMDDPGRARAMGEAGRAHVLNEYNSAREATWMAALLTGRAPKTLRPKS